MSEVSGETKVLRMPGAIKVLVISLVIAMILSYVAIMVGVAPASNVPAHISYTSHATISINGNADFATQATANSWSGDGSPGNPYVVQGYDIDATSANGIYILNTNVHFIVRDCYVHGGGLNFNGIHLESSTNGIISNNTYSNNWCGIALSTSNNNTLSNNNCSSNIAHGIHLSISSNNTLSNNTCCSNIQEGIYVETSSNDNTLSNNTCCSNNQFGIYLYFSSNSTIVWNHLCNNSGYGVFIESGSNNRIWSNTFINNFGAGSIYNVLHIQAYDDSANNRWNSSGYGNYWSDWTMPDKDKNGIVDIPYNISGSVGIKDCFPLSDLHPPTTTPSLFGTLGTNSWYRSQVTVSLLATDSQSGVNTTFYRISTSGSWLNYSTSFVISSQGNSTVQFYSRDNASNNELAKSVVIKIDSVKPTLNILTANNTQFSTDQVSIELNASDATSGLYYFEFAFDGSDYFSNTSIANQTYTISGQVGGQLADGAHYVIIRFVDKAGNVNETRLDFKVHISGSLIAGVPDWALFSVIIIGIGVVFTSLLFMRKKKSPPKRLDEMKPEQPAPPAV